ncbi:hypothetical protein V6N12_016016 [Hibiscus sabdariffa]|uniref:Uncharacterized protein n=1 Tax=Hibiscus sabdariffa TaxID=183260 RepID=A0ABR2DPU9_9ROSI
MDWFFPQSAGSFSVYPMKIYQSCSTTRDQNSNYKVTGE